MNLFSLFYLYRLQKNQWKSLPQINKIRDLKLQRLIQHAYHNVPYYKNLFDHNKIKPEDIQTAEDLIKIPVTSRKTLQELPLSEKTAAGTDIKKYRASATSGTTGIPLKIYTTSSDSTMMSLSWARAFLSSGMRPWDKMLAFIGQKRVSSKKPWYQHFGLWPRKEISNWNPPEVWIEEIRKWQPKVLIGYEMTLRILAETIQQNQIKDIRPKKIFHSSGILNPSSRDYLESTFKCKVTDIYGSDEAGCIAWKCPDCSSYHIYADMVILEIIQKGKTIPSGESGEMTITNLHSYAMPFIRYQQGDMGILSLKNPVCGRGFPLLEKIEGRTDDFIILSSGLRISPHPFYHCMDPVQGIRRWRITQDNINKLTVEIEPGKMFSQQTILNIQKNLKELVADKIEIRIIKVESITIASGIKFRAVNSKVRRDI